MSGQWQAWKRKYGGEALRPMAEQVALVRTGSAVAWLDDLRLMRVEGADAEAFLQGQLSSDVRGLSETRASYSTYSSAKGRMLASFLMWKSQGAIHALLAADVAEAVAKRLTMFVMRSKVRIELVPSESVALLGVSLGAAADLSISSESLFVSQQESIQTVSLPGGGAVLVLADDECLEKTLGQLNAEAVSGQAWQIRDIDAGIAWVRQATQEQFVPQMANMELIGAVSFQKGCYPGQEIVARTQYLGKLKRRLYRIELAAPAAVGDKLYSPHVPDQSIGMVAAICQTGEGTFEGLAVVQSACWEEGVMLNSIEGVKLVCRKLPYELPDA